MKTPKKRSRSVFISSFVAVMLGTAWADPAVSGSPSRRSWYRPPAPNATDEITQLLCDGGVSVFLFPSPTLGGINDLWALRLDPDGTVSTAFLGALPYPKTGPGDLTAVREGGKLYVTRGGVARLLVNDPEAWRDTDQDALPDLVEMRLRLDPANPDTDCDGIVDSEDMAPNATHKGSGDDDEIALGIFKALFFDEQEDDAASYVPQIVVSDAGLEWPRRFGPIITLGLRDDQEYFDEVGFYVSHFTIRPADPNGRRAKVPPPALAPGERLWEVIRFAGELDTEGFDVVVCQSNGHWFVKQMRSTWGT